MISASSFRTEWEATGDRLVAASPEAVASIPLTHEDALFLIEAGLPEEAAPFLSFKELSAPNIPLVCHIWHLPSTFPDYWCIGSNGSGDPICLATTGEVHSLNHDNNFEAELINTSVRQLAETLLAYREVVAITLAKGDEDAFLDGRVPVDVQHWFRKRLKAIDPQVAIGPSLWTVEMETWMDGAA